MIQTHMHAMIGLMHLNTLNKKRLIGLKQNTYLSKSKYSLEENALFFTTLDLGQMFLNSLSMFPFIQFSSSHLRFSPLLFK